MKTDGNAQGKVRDDGGEEDHWNDRARIWSSCHEDLLVELLCCNQGETARTAYAAFLEAHASFREVVDSDDRSAFCRLGDAMRSAGQVSRDEVGVLRQVVLMQELRRVFLSKVADRQE